MRIPHVNWKSLLEVFEKVVVAVKLIEGVSTMFGFFTKIKADVAAIGTKVETEVASLKAEFESLKAKVESFFPDKATDAAPVTAAPEESAPAATSPTESGNTPTTGA